MTINFLQWKLRNVTIYAPYCVSMLTQPCSQAPPSFLFCTNSWVGPSNKAVLANWFELQGCRQVLQFEGANFHLPLIISSCVLWLCAISFKYKSPKFGGSLAPPSTHLSTAFSQHPAWLATILLPFCLHCKNIRVTSTMFWSSQLHTCCVSETLHELHQSMLTI